MSITDITSTHQMLRKLCILMRENRIQADAITDLVRRLRSEAPDVGPNDDFLPAFPNENVLAAVCKELDDLAIHRGFTVTELFHLSWLKGFVIKRNVLAVKVINDFLRGQKYAEFLVRFEHPAEDNVIVISVA